MRQNLIYYLIANYFNNKTLYTIKYKYKQLVILWIKNELVDYIQI